MINATIKQYQITEKIGAGGMGIVYKAYDSKLDRTVALKFLPPKISASEERKKRFLNEARAASALDHHNTCTIHEINETDDGHLFIVMPAYEGNTLDNVIKNGKLSISDTINYGVQIAEGLKAAHSKQIVHRDIKSSNIMIDDDGHAVIMDFGLARKEEYTQLTNEGMTLGTVNYMSPEQASGDEVDHRTDIWSLGAVLYEMLTGQVPFRSEFPQAVIYSILNEDPKALDAFRNDIPTVLKKIVGKALTKDKKERYQNIDELLADLNSLGDEKSFGATILDSGWKETVTLRNSLTAVSVFVLVTFGIGYFFFNQSNDISFEQRGWIMVADFENRTGEEVFDNFLGGVLEIGITQSSYVNLYPRISILDFLWNEMQMEDVISIDQEIVKEAAIYKGAEVIVMPVITKKDSIYSLTATLEHVIKGEHATLGPITAVNQTSVLQAIDQLARNIRFKLGEPSSQISNGYTPVARATTSSLEALKLYVEGMRIKGLDNATGIQLIEQAVQIDPEFALAHAELGMNYYIQSNRQRGEEHFKKAMDQITRLTTRERLWIQAVVDDWRGNRSGAIDKYRTYLTQYPDDYSGWWRIGYTFLITGNHQLCIDAYSQVIEFDPRDASALVNLASCYNGLKRDSLALKTYQQAFELRPEYITGQYLNNEYGFLLARMGQIDQAKETFELMLTNSDTKARGLRNLALLNMYQGKFNAAIELLDQSIRINQSPDYRLSELRDRMYLARIYHIKGMEEAFSSLLVKIEELVNEMRLSPRWLADLGKLYVRTGHASKASELLQVLEDRIEDPVALSGVNRNFSNDHSYFYMLKGEIELLTGSYADAIESLEIAHNISKISESIAHGYLVSGDLQSAIEQYEQIIANKKLGREYQQDWILAHYQLGTIHERLGNREDAIRLYNDFIEIWEEGDDDIPLIEDTKIRLQTLI